MDLSLDFCEPDTAAYSPGAHDDRGAIFALRILLQHPERMSSAMSDCEALLKLLGRNAIWSEKILRKILVSLQGTDEEQSDISRNVPTLVDVVICLKKARAWSAYEHTIGKLYEDAPKSIADALKKTLVQLEKQIPIRTPRNRNVQMLAKFLKLNETELRLLDFAETRRSLRNFQIFLRSIQDFPSCDAYAYISSAIECPIDSIRTALRAKSPLRAYGLLRLDTTPNDLEDFLGLDDTGQRLLTELYGNADEMLRSILQPSKDPHLEAQDYRHLGSEFSWLAHYLRNVTADRIKGCNILFYGAPGTGKTEFARLLAKEAGLTAFDIESSDMDGDPVPGRRRLGLFAMSQRFLAERNDALLIFDEIEDVFPSMPFNSGREERDQPKAWLNQQLEQSPVPAIWISNSIAAMDEAYLRRFAFHVEFRTPPKSVRERIIKRNLQSLHISEQIIASLVADDSLSPAQIEQASRFASLCKAANSDADESAFIQAIKFSQQAMGRSFRTNNAAGKPPLCNFAYLNLATDLPVVKIEQSLRRKPSASLCFYGVPGAGKTMLARYLADSIDRPLLIKRASDLLSKYVGQSEKLIASSFREAEREGAVLLLDEADSFLCSRQRASQSWEVTQVNEMLQQMESFNGVFICTTNLMDDIDEAALRRFTFKVQFDALRLDQRIAMFAESVRGDPHACLPLNIESALQNLSNVTPGDFANVQRQEHLLGERYSPSEFLECLERECALKPGGKTQKIGFLG